MTDLVERLRRFAAYDGYYAEALAEIEQLRARDAELRYEAGMYRALYENMMTRAEKAEAKLDPLKTLPPCMMPDGGDCCPEFSAQKARAEAAEAAFLYYIQNDNGCEVTGKPCRNPEQCGCYQETQP